MLVEHFDVLIVGAGLSGIASACMLQGSCPGKRFAILEARADLGGTWDLFRYPGVRSDSDMYTLGYSFRPWLSSATFASGASILRYIRDTAREYGVDRNIRFEHRVRKVSWSSPAARWTVQVERGAPGVQTTVCFTCNFLFSCTGYYDYAAGHQPIFPGSERFAGILVHPQQWPSTLDIAGKRIIVIGSGSTAVTLVPALATRAAHVTMLQRSPSYVMAAASQRRRTQTLQRYLPPHIVYRLLRWRGILVGWAFFQACRRYPRLLRRWITRAVRSQLGAAYDVATDFTPRYNPWEQRLCLVPDGDLFKALRDGTAAICTGEILHFTHCGLQLRDGRALDADIIVSATGLTVLVLGGMTIEVDGRQVDLAHTTRYKGSMYSGVPNLACAMGYLNLPWTLKCELIADYVGRVLRYMDLRGYRVCTPVIGLASVQQQPWVNLSSGYMQRAQGRWPRGGSRGPWKVHHSYLRDLLMFRLNAIDDGELRFS